MTRRAALALLLAGCAPNPQGTQGEPPAGNPAPAPAPVCAGPDQEPTADLGVADCAIAD